MSAVATSKKGRPAPFLFRVPGRPAPACVSGSETTVTGLYDRHVIVHATRRFAPGMIVHFWTADETRMTGEIKLMQLVSGGWYRYSIEVHRCRTQERSVARFVIGGPATGRER